MAASDGIPEIDEFAEEGDDGSGNRRLLAVIALVALIFILLWLFLSQSANVPDVVGMKLADAKIVIADAGFVVGEVDTIKSGQDRPGDVTAQAPAGGSRRLKGAQIDLTVAAGSGDRDDGDSDSGDDASGDTGLDLSATPTDTPDMGDGSSGGAIDYGPQVPQVLGMSQSKAISTLRAAGYNPVVEGYGPSTTTVAAGLVFYQNPPPGAFEPRGKTINLWISTGNLDHQMPYPEPE